MNTEYKIIFFRQLSLLLKSGIALVEALTLLEKNFLSSQQQLLLFKLKRDIQKGKSFSTVITAYKEHFGELAYQLICVGDQTGNLDNILEHLANHLDKQYRFSKKITQACIYPSIVLLATFLLFIVMVFFIIPKFKLMAQDFPNKLPRLTQGLFDACDILQYLIIISFLLTGLIFLYNHYCKGWQIKQIFYYYLAKLPRFANLLNKIQLMHFLMQLSTMLEAGFPITRALSMMDKRSVVACDKIADLIRQGFTFHATLNKLASFPPLMIQMITIGEASGRLGEMLKHNALIFEQEIDQQLHELTQLIEPLLMLFVGVIVGFLLIALYLPIFNLNNGI